MSFIRPEAAQFLRRWREVLILGAMACLGVWIALRPGFFFPVAGWALLAFSILLIPVAIRRAQFPAGGGGVGLVEVDERQITYFAPRGGGSVSIDALTAVDIRTTDRGPFQSDLFWVFTTVDGGTLIVPGDAENADALFDALTALPGVDYKAATDAALTPENAVFPVWRRDRPVALREP